MSLDVYEYTKIGIDELPKTWQSQEAIDGLSNFLQKNWEQRYILYSDGDSKKEQQFISFLGSKAIKTKKYVGTIVYKGEQVNIYPRVFKYNKENKNTDTLSQKLFVNNLTKWLEYSNKIDYPFINISSDLRDEDNLIELFITLYISYVQYTMNRGLYFVYIDETENSSYIKGKFDIIDYVVNKIPNGNATHFCCTYSSFQYNNKVNQIIKFTCKQLFNITSKKNKKIIRKILTKLGDVDDVVCFPSDCTSIRLSKMHRDYEMILNMSRMFLLNKVSNYSFNTNQAFCFLFPMELLFEGFIGGFFRETIEDLGGRVKLQENRANLIDKILYKGQIGGPAFNLRHDILAKLNGKTFIMDTKYKEVSRFDGEEDVEEHIADEVKQVDLYQVIEYARKRELNDVFLIYPMYRMEQLEDEYPVAVSESKSGNIQVHFIRIPFVFEDDGANTKEDIKKVINYIITR